MGRRISAVLTLLLLLGLGFVGGCSGGEEVLFAVILPLSGEWAIYGQPIEKGVELAMDEIHRRKDLPFTIKIEIADSQSRPEKAAEQLEAMYDKGALAALGGVTSESALAMIPITEREEKILLSPAASSPELSGKSRYFFRVFPSDFREGTKMGNFAAQSLHLDNVVILAADSTYARGITEVFKNEFERYHRKVLDTLVYPEGTEDFGGLVRQALDQEPEAVYVADFAEPVRRILAQLKAAGFRGKVMTTSAFNAPDVLAAAGEDAEDVILTQTAFEPDSEEADQGDPVVQRFVEAYRKKFGDTPGTFAAHGYDAMMVLADATRGMNAPLGSEMLKGIRSLGNDYRGVTGPLQFDERGDVGQFPRVYIYQDGEFEDYDRAREESRQILLDRLNEIRRQRERRLRQGSESP